MIKKLKRTARIAGVLYLILAITGAYGIVYIPTKLFVAGDAAATVNNILKNEFFFRTGIFSNFICQIIFIFLALTLYNLFKQVNERLAKTLVALVIASIPVTFFIIFNQLFSLITLKENFMNVFEKSQQDSLTMIHLKMYEHGNIVIGIFWGLWLIPFGQLVWKSGFIPKIFGLFLVIAGLSYVIDASVFILFPNLQFISANIVAVTSSIAEFSMVLWLLIKGVNERKIYVFTSE